MKGKILLIGLITILLTSLVFAGTVTRSISDTAPNAGTTITITLTIDADTGDKAILIHEEAPFTITGLTTNIYETGLLDQIQVQDTTRQYSLYIPITATNTYVFSGKYTVNGGNDQTITGDSSITIGGGPCIPTTCSALGKNCGTWDDGCGVTLNCGSCSSGEICELGICVIVCTDTTWTPAVSTICSGQSFTQRSNCENTRTATGTKDCPEEECEFWEKMKEGECVVNTGFFILIGIGLFMFKMFQ